MPSSDESGFSRHGQLQEVIPTTVNKTGLWRFLTPVFQEKVSPCRLSCPLENGIPLWMNMIRQDDWQGAWRVMQEYNPFPAITGYVCYRFCEEKCHRGLWDEPVAVREIEKAIGLWRHDNYRAGENGKSGGRDRMQRGKMKKVAIVGSGPAGLSCAYYLRKQGVTVTVFEKLSLAGGLLATGIPEYRLPRHILKKELEILEAEGVTFEVGREVGREIDLAKLQDDFDAVLLAVGAQKSRRLQIRGEELPGVIGALEFLRDLHLGLPPREADHVVVVGGGNAAVDAACMARLQGARVVNLLYRRSREEIPAHSEEIKAAAEAGVKFTFQTVLQEVCGGGCVQKVRARRVASSRRGEQLQVLPGTSYELPCDLLIIAAGQESGLPKLASSLQVLPVMEEGYGEGSAGGKERLGDENIVLMAGDALTGPASVASAIFSGRKAALMLLRALDIYPEPEDIPGIVFPLQGEEEAIPYEHLNPVLYPRLGRLATALEEAGRCFSCGTCNSCGVCWVFCPEPAIGENNGKFEILLDYCKGCGICVTECPAGVLAMEEVPWHEK